MRKDNFTQVLRRFVQELSIPVTLKSIKDELQIHPEYNSLIAISDLLNTWLVPNAAYQLTFDELLGAEIEDPFIAFISDKEFAVVSHLDKNYAILSNEKWNNHQLTIAEFEEIYSGSILVAEREATSGEADYKANCRKETYDRLITPSILLCAAVILLTFLIIHFGYFTANILLLILLKTAGVAAVVILIIQSLEPSNPVFKKLCGSTYHNDCSAVLSSKGAKIYDLISWSEIGLFYFVSSWMVLLFNSDNVVLLNALGILNLLSLPFTFYFIYYQWKVVKEWCILCCMVQALLWLEFVIFLPFISRGIVIPDLAGWVNMAIALVIPIVLWTSIKSYLTLPKTLQILEKELQEFKYNKNVFQASLNESVKYGLIADKDSIIFGNRQAEITLTVVLKPYGKLSAEAYQGLGWVAGRDDVKLQIVFATPRNLNDPDSRVAMHMLSLTEKSLSKAIDNWFNQNRKDYDTWSDMYPSNKIDTVGGVLIANNEWCQMTDVSSVPAIFINGRKLKLNYKTADLKYFF
ncbi:hypothetical protein GCM10027049_13160 [Mucilaginibacter puniceus]